MMYMYAMMTMLYHAMMQVVAALRTMLGQVHALQAHADAHRMAVEVGEQCGQGSEGVECEDV